MENQTKYKLNFANPDAVSSLTVIHYGAKKYIESSIKPISNENWVKPKGGLWTSPVDSNWGWKDWCEGAEFRQCHESNSFKLKFNPDTKIILIDSLKDLIELPLLDIGLGSIKREYPDFSFLSTMCDAIWLTEKGQGETHLTYPISLYGWDCESVLIMNPKCCFEV
jgi:hypothetical protein